MPEDHEEAIRSSFEAWNEGDFERWLQQAHPDCEYGPGILIGRTEGEQVVYRGSVTHYHLRGPGGGVLMAAQQNTDGDRTIGAVSVGEEVQVSWEATSALVVRDE